jgi:hypothetical protein
VLAAAGLFENSDAALHKASPCGYCADAAFNSPNRKRAHAPGASCVRRAQWEEEGSLGPIKEKRKKRKKTALVVCRDRKEFWTTQTQFWQWVREGVVVKTGDRPLRGDFKHEHQELLVLLSNTVLNLACPNHLTEALRSRRRAGRSK